MVEEDVVIDGGVIAFNVRLHDEGMVGEFFEAFSEGFFSAAVSF